MNDLCVAVWRRCHHIMCTSVLHSSLCAVVIGVRDSQKIEIEQLHGWNSRRTKYLFISFHAKFVDRWINIKHSSVYAQDTTKNRRFYHINYALFPLFIRTEDQRRRCRGIRNPILDTRVFGERENKNFNQTFAQTKHTGEVHFACVHRTRDRCFFYWFASQPSIPIAKNYSVCLNGLGIAYSGDNFRLP